MNKTVYIRILTLLIFFLCIKSVKSQIQITDSLENLLFQHTTRDTVRVNLLNETAFKFYRVDIEKTLNYAKEAEELAEQLHFKKGKAESLKFIGIYYNIKSDYSIALEYFQKSLKIYEKLGNNKGIAESYKNIGLIYQTKGEYSKALAFYQKSLKIEEANNHKLGVSKVYHNIGNIYFRQRDYTYALEFYKKSLKIKEELGDIKGIARSYSNFGTVYASLGAYSDALEYYEKSLEISRELGIKKDIASGINNVGVVNMDLFFYQKALKCFHESLILKKELGNKNGICAAYMNIGEVYLNTNQYDKALEYALKSLEIAKELETIDMQKEIYLLLSDIYAETNNYKNAYENYMLYKALNDSIFNEENIKKITSLKYQYKYEKEKQAIELEQQKKDVLTKEEKRRLRFVRNFFIAGFVLTMALVLMIFRVLRKKKEAYQILNKQKGKIQEQQAVIIKKETNEINNQLKQKKAELENTKLRLINYGLCISKFIKDIKSLNPYINKEGKNIAQSLIGYYMIENKERACEEIELSFKETGNYFYEKLERLYPELTQTEKRICLFLYLKMTTKQIADILYKSVRTLENKRTSIRKKMNLKGSTKSLESALYEIQKLP